MEGLVFNIQKYALHDGPGIRTTVFLKGCPLSCLWCHNPESIGLENELMFHKTKCIHCNSCEDYKNSDVCPTLALERVGQVYSVDALLNEIIKDVVFYDQSHGGVTFSGGEPLLQHDFLLEVLKVCKAHDIHTTLDTSGFASWTQIEKLLPYVDLVLFDIKHLDNDKHISFTGVSNQLIIENFKKLVFLKDVYVRVPLIKGFNDDLDYIHQLCHFLKAYPFQQINFLPYHNYAEHKYSDLKVKREFTSFEKPNVERLENILKVCLEYDIKAQIGGDIC